MKGSIVAVLRVSGPDLNVDEFVTAHELAVDRVWRRGESGRRGEVRAESGFNLAIADVTSADALRQAISAFLDASHGLTASLAAARAHAELDVGLMLDAVAPRSVGFPTKLLADLVSAGIAVRVTAYPCSEETDEHAR